MVGCGGVGVNGALSLAGGLGHRVGGAAQVRFPERLLGDLPPVPSPDHGEGREAYRPGR